MAHGAPRLTWRNAGLIAVTIVLAVSEHPTTDAMAQWLTTHIEPPPAEQSIFDQFMQQQAHR